MLPKSEQQNQPSNESEITIGIESGDKKEREEISRRDFLRFLGGAAALFAVEGCASIGATRNEVERSAELIDRREVFEKRWQIVLEEGVKKFETDPEMIARYSPEGVAELAEILRDFNIEEYINTLAEIANIRPAEIGGEILSFEILPSTKNGTMAAVRDLRHMELYLGEWMKLNGSFHEGTISAVLKHELTHIFSFDYQAPLKESVPLAYEEQRLGWQEKSHIGLTLYEGSTEVVALTASASRPGEKSVEQGYRGGGTLSAYVLSELLGRADFLKAYLRRDTRLLKSLFDVKIGQGSDFQLTRSVNSGANILNRSYDDSLDFLHNAFRSKQIDRIKLKLILEKAQKEGVSERVEHVVI